MTFYNIKTKSSEYQPINSNMMKRYLTNTDKSVFNLKWENRDVAQQHSQRIRDNGKLKIEHHYVDSPAEAQRLIAKLHRKGFVETGIYTPAVDSNYNKN
ncbi:unnamed protein product [Rotaria sordida]|uniref:Uncharacterized protein n=1 Tax=Rotaria sordida TaxID=392033 RepID=A0A819WSQ1_9BILA|nr:unnamed protein product [Rotaria sordida]